MYVSFDVVCLPGCNFSAIIVSCVSNYAEMQHGKFCKMQVILQ